MPNTTLVDLLLLSQRCPDGHPWWRHHAKRVLGVEPSPEGFWFVCVCHELAHNVHDDHDDDFKALKSTLSREYSLHLARERAAPSVGGGAARAPDEEAEAAAGDGTHVLGGGGGAPGDARSAAAAAAERRAAAAEEGCVPCEDEGG